MDQEPKLRSIPPGGLGPRGGASARGSSDSARGRIHLALGVALAIALVLLVWSYFSLGTRIEALEIETRTLRQSVAERDDVISAQRSRLDEVRGRLQQLLKLLEEPVPGAPAPSTPAPEPAEAPTSESP
jgi:uncharacterized coiled-coil protein SlyX